MPTEFSYVSLNNLKVRVSSTTSAQEGNDPLLRAIAEAVSRQFDEYLGANRTFRVYLSTRYYTPMSAYRLLLDADLLAVTTLKADEDGDRTYERTWATTDYDLKPFNASTDQKPYWELAVTPDGTLRFPRIAKGVELIGKWGYREDLLTSASTTTEVLDTTETGVDVTNGNDFEVLQTILVESEQMYITAINSNTLTVIRGVNGTTAATHVTASTVRVYRYPWQVVEAAVMHISKLWTRRASNFANSVGMMESGQVPVREGLDFAVMDMLAPFRQPLVVQSG